MVTVVIFVTGTCKQPLAFDHRWLENHMGTKIDVLTPCKSGQARCFLFVCFVKYRCRFTLTGIHPHCVH